MGALDGVLVVAIEQAVSAPLCTVRLADAGARVIKIERPDGETARHYDTAVHGTSTYFAWLNRGKESAVLDLKSPDDMALFRNMLAQADVLVQNLAPGAMTRLGLGNPRLSADFPRLIAVSICGYGTDTDYAEMRAYDMLVQAESGVCATTGLPDQPVKVGPPVADICTGANAHAAILEALIERGRTGQGKMIEVPMFDGLVDWMTVPFLHFEHSGHETQRYGLSHATVYPYRPYACKDGTLIIAVQNNAQWLRLCNGVLDLPDLSERTEFSSNEARVKNREALDRVVAPIFANLSLKEAIARCDTASIAWAQYRDIEHLTTHPAVRRMTVKLDNGMSVSIPKPAGRELPQTPPVLPALGAHTQSLREEFGTPTA